MSRILLLPKLHIHNANALSSPYTIGFPAMTAWLGAAHALQRKLNQNTPDLRFTRVGVVCHQFKLQAHQGDYHEYVLIGTSNPLDKNGDRPSFIEEARCDLTVSLIIEFTTRRNINLQSVENQLHRLKWASGDLIQHHKPELHTIETDNEFKKLTRRLMPSYTLLERRDLVIEALQKAELNEKNEKQDVLDVLLDYLSIQHRSTAIKDENGNIIKGEWTSTRKSKGWLVPIATGFHGITELGNAENQRDPNTPHRFAESIVTLGEFKMPHKLDNLEQLLWRSYYDAENNLYLIQQ